MEVTTKVTGEFTEISSTEEQGLITPYLSNDLREVVGIIQEKTEYNQRYDYIKEDAAEGHFIISIVYGTGALFSKGPANAKYIGGLIMTGAAYYNSRRDNRGRTVTILPKIETK